jgi:hypothetical protein
MSPRRTVTFDGQMYKVRSTKVEIPDLAAMTRIEALVWLNQNTYRRGYSKARSPLEGMGAALTLRAR